MKDLGFKEYFTFSKGEKNGIIILSIIIVLLLFVPTLLKEFYKPTPISNLEYYNRVDSFFSSLNQKPDNENNSINLVEKEEIPSIKEVNYFYFDPNTIEIEKLVELGFTLKQAQVIIKYRERGGKFFKPEDFAKVYVVDSSFYSRLKPWIKINSNLIQNNVSESKNELKVEKIFIDLNSADTLELTKINGLGKIFARRIISYRDLLGGFNNLNQLNEVWGFSPALVQKISSQIWVDSSKIKLININLVSFEDIKKHPYLTEYQAKGIIYYRSKVGTIKSPDELVKQKIIPLDKFFKLKPYIVVN